METLGISSPDLSERQETFSSGVPKDPETIPFHESPDILQIESWFYRKNVVPPSSPSFLEPETYKEPLSLRDDINFSSETIKQPEGVRIYALVATTESTVRPEDIVSMSINFPDPSSSSLSPDSQLEFLSSLFQNSFKKLQNLRLSKLAPNSSMDKLVEKMDLNWLGLDDPRFNSELHRFSSGFKNLSLALTKESSMVIEPRIPHHIENLYIHIYDHMSCQKAPNIWLRACESLKNM